MALIKTIAEVKEMLPNFVSNLSDPASLPNFLAAEYKYLVPLTGTALYNDIHTKYDTAATLTADESNLLKKMRLVAVAYAYHDGLMLGHITLTDNGARKFNPNNTVPVAKWEYEKLERSLLNVAYDATEVLLAFLFEKKADFSLWTASPEYAAIDSLLIKTGTDFNNQYNLYQPMRTFYNIRNVITDVQELYLQPGLGADLFSHILANADADATMKKIVSRLKKALAFFSIKHCCLHYNVRFSHEGFTVLGGEGNFDSADHSGRKAAEPTDLDMRIKACEQQGQDFLSKAIEDMVVYYKTTDAPLASAGYKAALDKGPLTGLINPDETTSGNEVRKGVFRL